VVNRETLDELRGLATQLLTSITSLAEEPPPRLVTPDAAAEAIGVSRSTLQELIDSGKLPVVEVTGRAVRVDVRDIEVFIKQRRVRRG
jgi:excisionase family DNA binding protein